MQRSALISVLLLTALLAPGPLPAQEPWPLSMTAPSSDADAYAQDAQQEERKRLAQQPTGIDTGGANLATTMKDLLPDMAVSGLLGESSAKDNPGTVVLDLNFVLSEILGKAGFKDTQLQGIVNTQPQLSDALRSGLPADRRDDLAGQLKGRIGRLGDSALRFTFSPATRTLGRKWMTMGRNFGQYADWFDTMCRAVAKDALPNSVNEANKSADEAGLTLYHQLINNQPQFLFTAERKFRDPLVGPDELGVKVTYEWGRMNFNTMTGACDPKNKSFSCYKNFMNKENRDAIKKGIRFAVSAEYNAIDGETIDTGLPGISPIVLKPVHKLILHGGWSRDFTALGGPMKADLLADYEDVSNDPLRRDRGIVRLTFTRQMGQMSIPFGIVYANHGEFLSDVDARFSAHFGFRLPISMINGNNSQ